MNNKLEELRKIIDSSETIVFFGGAGVSTESNIPDFRSATGIYNQKSIIPPETILSHSFFIKNTKEFYEFYKNKMIYKDAKPNITHEFLADLEKKGKLKAIITQNIDGLHQKAGSKNVLELHGNITKNYCMNCLKSYDLDYIINSDNIPLCSKCGGIIKPDVVLYEESLDQDTLDESIYQISNCDTLIVGGTSLTVYPASGLIRFFQGKNLVIINKQITNYDNIATLVISEKLGNVFRKLIGDNSDI